MYSFPGINSWMVEIITGGLDGQLESQ